MKLTNFAKRNLKECIKCDHIRPAVKYKTGSKKRIKEAACLQRGIAIKDKSTICIWRSY